MVNINLLVLLMIYLIEHQHDILFNDTWDSFHQSNIYIYIYIYIYSYNLDEVE